MKNFLIKVFNIIIQTSIIVIKLLFCLFFTVMAGYGIILITVVAFTTIKQLDWQIIFYIILSVVAIIGLWLICFVKTEKKIKLIYLSIFVTFLISPRFLPSVMYQLDFDSCIDTGICAEGIKFGKEVMSKDYCLKQGKTWLQEKKSCDMRIKPRTLNK